MCQNHQPDSTRQEAYNLSDVAEVYVSQPGDSTECVETRRAGKTSSPVLSNTILLRLPFRSDAILGQAHILLCLDYPVGEIIERAFTSNAVKKVLDPNGWSVMATEREGGC